MEITPIGKKRALAHCDNIDLVDDNCKNLPHDRRWVIISSGVDKGAFLSDGKTLHISMGGTSSFLEIISNFRVLSKNGLHRGFRKNGVELYRDLIKKLPYHISHYTKIKADGHSRGAPLVETIFLQIWKGAEKGLYKAPKMSVVTSGDPVLYTEKMLKFVQDNNIYTKHALLTKRDFVDDINAPKGFFLKKLWRKLRLHQYRTVVYNLPTVKGKIDHLISAYREAINKFDWDKIGGGN